jgi:hypothetical protein
MDCDAGWRLLDSDEPTILQSTSLRPVRRGYTVVSASRHERTFKGAVLDL